MKQIIALGGGGFFMEPHNPLLDTYILQQSNKANPKICFVPTASGDSENYMARFYSFFDSQSCVPSHLSLFSPPTRDLESFIMEKDIIYVGGGNTKLSSGIAADDGVAVHYIDQEIHKIVSSKPNGKAYKVSLDKEINEEELAVKYLGTID
ncbi:Type 1 glutamine amidotransferase-like domain-containing protein [Lysinibacillus sp. NPDC056232]|uniref:Type 1 glutamine amidotransferase-like domain-containing protein n=1 Tax=Lysinibacillus sp. NPDC056232 TaxID=3345756 RepID=UPI0035D92330